MAIDSFLVFRIGCLAYSDQQAVFGEKSAAAATIDWLSGDDDIRWWADVSVDCVDSTLHDGRLATVVTTHTEYAIAANRRVGIERDACWSNLHVRFHSDESEVILEIVS